MKESRHELRLTGSGPTRERAFGAALAQVQPEVAKRVEGVCFRVEPRGLEVVSAVEHRWTERFLGLLFPRRRSRFEIGVRVSVRVVALDLARVDFAVREERLTAAQHLLQMR